MATAPHNPLFFDNFPDVESRGLTPFPRFPQIGRELLLQREIGQLAQVAFGIAIWARELEQTGIG